MKTFGKNKILFFNIGFAVVAAVILLILTRAPEITTPKLPHDDDHNRFFSMKKKAASKLCDECHTSEEIEEIHRDNTPNTNRCLFCHRRD